MIQTQDDAPYADWEPTLSAVAGATTRVLLLGGMDVGKTTFTRLLANRMIASGRSVAVIDADLGQSEIGPPGCIGLGFPDAPVQALSDISPHALAFVGATSPAGYLLECSVGVRRLMDMTQSRPTLVDTSGFVQGPGARRLAQAEFELLLPSDVVALQRSDELESILAPMRRRSDCRVHTPPVPAVLSAKPPSFRAQRRAMRFAAYFHGASIHTYPLDQMALTGTWLGSGAPVAPHLLKFLNQCLGPSTRVYHAEMSARHLGLMVSRRIPENAPAMGMALSQLRAQSVSVTVAPRLKHLLLGLDGGNGKLLGLGLLEAMDFRRGTLGVLTPVRTPSAAQVIRFGGARVAPDGTEQPALKPGELL